ncbi:phycobilisome rod-core linker polypeptide [Magnetococcales bacterium HHB-1]
MADSYSWSETTDLMQMIHQQILEEKEPPQEHWDRLAPALLKGDLSVKEILLDVACSDRYEERFVRHLNAEEIARFMLRHIMADNAPDAEAIRKIAEGVAQHGWKKEIVALFNSLQYSDKFTEDQVPG